jgi:Ca-activated chloride channel homolog
MNDKISEQIFPADPRITAYAFGELEGDELKLIEAAVNADPALQAAVAELRGFGGQLATALGDETSEVAAPVVAPVSKKTRARLIPFPLHYLATAAAACFAVVVWVRYENQPVSQPKGVESEAPAVAYEAKLSKDEHRLQVARKAAVDSATSSPVSDARIAFEAVAAMQMPELPPSPLVVGSVSSGMGYGAGTGTVGSGTGYITGQGAGIAQASRERPSASMPAPAPVAAPLSVNLSANYKSDYVERDSNMAIGGVSNGFGIGNMSSGFDQARLNTSNEAYSLPSDNVYRNVTTDPLSTFSVDVDTASYSNVRRFLTSGRLPPRDAVRVEELINYFPYRYTPPTGDVPFAAKLEVASAPWAPEHRLVRIGLKGREFTAESRPPANLVFLLDVSGSMSSANKLPLVKESLRMLVERLRPDDRVAIVTYAGSSGLALPSTPASKKNEILASLDNLNSGGSTNGAMGIHLAYDIAKANFMANGGINRVILCTDGDFNVGVTNRDELVGLIEEKAKSRVFLSIFGFGMGNLKDSTLEALSGKGNGTYGYIDNRREAEKIFVEQVEGTLATIAKDVKIQVEFNPAKVASYRLIGYENRILAKEDFNNDAVDAGDIGAGHTVTALYEIVPVGVDSDGSERPLVDPLKYQKTPGNVRKPATNTTGSRELLTVKIRYKAPEGDVSKKQEFPLVDAGAGFAKADGEFRFAAAVAAWGMLLRDSPHKGSATFEQVLTWAEDGLGDDAGGHRAEFIQLVRKSAELGR